jgi:tetratricopeptide (TPR) repeat protein
LTVLLAGALGLSGCSLLGGGQASVPVDDRSTSSGREQSHERQRAGAAQQAILVSPLERPERPAWEPIAAPAPQPDEQPPQRSFTPAERGDLNPAVVALLNRANRFERDGDLEQSAANLERALRIQPDNAWLWHRLALVHLFSHEDSEAIDMASKSNSLAQDNRRLQADNWKVIAQARERLGDLAAARAASRKAAELAR